MIKQVRAAVASLIVTTLLGCSQAAAPVALASVTPFEEWDREKTYRVLALGDSITWGVGDDLRNAYRRDLKSQLDGVGFKTNFVGSVMSGTLNDPEHEGHPGWTINQIRAEVYSYMATYQPDIVLIHLGTNDIGRNDNISTAHARLNALITQIRNVSTATVFVMQIAGFMNTTLQTATNSYNAKIPYMSNVGSANSVYVVNQSQVRGLMLWNNNHPNTFGYSQMAWNLFSVFRRVYSGNVWPIGIAPANQTAANVCTRNPAGGASICYIYVKENGQWVRKNRT